MSSSGGDNFHGKAKASRTGNVTSTSPRSHRIDGKSERRPPEFAVNRASHSEALREDVLSAVRKAVTRSANQNYSRFNVPEFDLNFSLASNDDNTPSTVAPPVFPDQDTGFSLPANENHIPVDKERLWSIRNLSIATAAVTALVMVALFQPWFVLKSELVASSTAPPDHKLATVGSDADLTTTPSQAPQDPTDETTAAFASVMEPDERVAPELSRNFGEPRIATEGASPDSTARPPDSVPKNSTSIATNAELTSKISDDANQNDTQSATARTKVARLTNSTTERSTIAVHNRAATPSEPKLPGSDGATIAPNTPTETELKPGNAEPPNTPAGSERVPSDAERASTAISHAMEGDPLFAVGPVTPERLKEAEAAYARAARLAGLKSSPMVAILEQKSIVAARGVSPQLLSEAKTLTKTGQVQAARAMMTMVAHANIPEVSFAIARSYDPTYLATLNSHDAKASITKATDWYRRWHNDSVASGQVSGGAYVERLIRSMTLYE